MTDLIKTMRDEAGRQEDWANDGEATVVGLGPELLARGADRIEQLEDRRKIQDELLTDKCDELKAATLRIAQLEKIMRGILAVDPDFGHGSAIVRNIQKMVRAALPEDRE